MRTGSGASSAISPVNSSECFGIVSIYTADRKQRRRLWQITWRKFSGIYQPFEA